MDLLNHENIDRSTAEVEYHPLKPFLPKECKVLFLGSFPPQRKRWCMDFFYPNFINDHWRIEGQIFFDNKNYFVDEENKSFRLEEIVQFLEEKGIGFFDTATAVHRQIDNASDKFLEVIEETDIEGLLTQVPECHTIAVTGEKATETICRHFGTNEQPKVGTYITLHCKNLKRDIRLYRLPSSSRAYPLKLDKKADAYRKMFVECGIMNDTNNEQTKRLIFRRWQETDANTLYKYASDPEVGPRAGWEPHKSVEESLETIRTIFGGETMWAVVLKDTNEPIGCIGYLPKGTTNIEVGENEVEVGYWIARPYWNLGICTEALTWMIDYCFNVKGITALWSDFFIDNPASGRVMEKCGFTDTGIETLCPDLYGGADRLVRIKKLVR